MATMVEHEKELNRKMLTATEMYRAYQRGAVVQFEDNDGNVVTVPTFEEAAMWFASYNANLGTVYYPFSVS